jgi:serine/threonine protein kinase
VVCAQLVEAAGLKEYLKEDRILRWFTMIVLALANIHSKNFMHRDIKPVTIPYDTAREHLSLTHRLTSVPSSHCPPRCAPVTLPQGNVFLSRWDVVKLGDFGLATLLPKRRPEEMSREGIAGTPGFMSPELAQGHPYNTKSDIYALGCTLYEMCTLRSCYRDLEKKQFPAPFPDCYPPELTALVKVQTDPAHTLRLPPFPRRTTNVPPSFSTGTPPPLSLLPQQMLAADPAQRPTSADLLSSPLLASRVEGIRREQELLSAVTTLEQKIEYTPIAARLRKLSSSSGGLGQGAGVPGAGTPVTNAAYFAQMMAGPMAHVGKGLALTKEAFIWLYGVLATPQRLHAQRQILSPEEAHWTALRVCNIILWLPVIIATLGYFGNTSHCTAQHCAQRAEHSA